MLDGYIIYNSSEAEKNRSFIEKFQEEGRQKGINFVYVPYDAPSGTYMEYGLPDLAINRTRDYRASRWYENKGVKVYNPSYLVYIGNNKYEALKYLAEHLPYEIKDTRWMAHTWSVKSHDMYKIPDGGYLSTLTRNLAGDADNDIIIKSVSGHGGSEVFLLEKGAGARRRKEIAECLAGRDCIVQERIASKSQDVRVYIIGGEIYASVIRTGNNDFRSNYSLGGNASEYKLDRAQRSYVMGFVQALGGSRIGMAGIDFILSEDGELIFNEVEDMAGSRMLYNCSRHDIVKDYVEWIAGTL